MRFRCSRRTRSLFERAQPAVRKTVMRIDERATVRMETMASQVLGLTRLMGTRERQHHGERRPLPGSALDFHLPVQGIDDFADNP